MRLGVDLTACWRPRVGMATVAVELTRELLGQARGGSRLTLFCSRERPAGLEAADASFVLSPWRHEVANKLRWLPAVEADAGLDVILYPYWPSPPRRRAGAPPAAVFVHDLAFRVRPDEVPWQQRLYMGSILGPSLRQAAAVITPSQATRRDLLLHYPIPGLEDRLHVVPEGRSLDRLEPGELPEGLAPGCFLLAVGTIEPRKNYPRLLEAYRLLRRRGLDLPLVVAGRVGWAYGRALDDLRAEPGVRLLGHVDDRTLRALYRSASVLAFPTLYEGFGLPLLEAFAEGLPAVAGGAGALPELAGEAALLIDPLDSRALADALERAVTDQALRTRLGAAGRERAAAYTWEAAGRRVLQILEGLASPSR
jgi:glycosyltransferase involved in cell wall biosynthesis